jgi:uncharacterized membrane protein YozB (DUF420 family)
VIETGKKTQLVLGTAKVVFGILALAWFIPRYAAPVGDDISLLPTLMAVTISILGAVTIANALMSRDRSEEKELSGSSGEVDNEKSRNRMVATSVLILLGLGWFAEQIGMILTSSAATFVLLIVFGERNRVLLALIPIIFAIILYLLFEVLLETPLPRGWFARSS